MTLHLTLYSNPNRNVSINVFRDYPRLKNILAKFFSSDPNSVFQGQLYLGVFRGQHKSWAINDTIQRNIKFCEEGVSPFFDKMDVILAFKSVKEFRSIISGFF